ncbi:MAG: magnesium transporter [Candidatus Omnitrophica bacterium]|nr:magnesium transporter [Candidatus Omnitrophota bacterium]
MKNQLPLVALTKKFFETDPGMVARHLETMPAEEVIEVFNKVSPLVALEAFKHLHDSTKAQLADKLSNELFIKFANHLQLADAANMFLGLSAEKRAIFLENLDEKKKKEIQELLTYPEDSAGRIMKTDFIAFHQDIRVKEAVQKIRELASKGNAASYIYALDYRGHLVGIMNMRDMLLAKETDILASIMRTDLFKVNCFDDREKVAHELSTRHVFAVPVVNSEGRLCGIIHAEQLIGDVQEEASEDLQKMFGASGDEHVFSPISFSLKTRLPWLYVNLMTAFLAAWVVSLFEDIIARITILAVYLPVVAGQGGNAGAQSLAVVMRGLVMREIPSSKARQLISKELQIGIINGLAIGVVTGLIAWLWQGNYMLGVVISLAMVVNLTIAGFVGALIPLSMKALGMDPAQCSSIILTTITDVMGFFAFLGFAVLFQHYLV